MAWFGWVAWRCASITEAYTNEPLVVSTPKTFSATVKFPLHSMFTHAPNLTLLISLAVLAVPVFFLFAFQFTFSLFFFISALFINYENRNFDQIATWTGTLLYAVRCTLHATRRVHLHGEWCNSTSWRQFELCLRVDARYKIFSSSRTEPVKSRFFSWEFRSHAISDRLTSN